MTPEIEPGEETRDDVMARYNAPDEWVNCGDANPEHHGGTWICFVDDVLTEWKIVHTVPSVEVGFSDADPDGEGDQYVMVGSVSPHDVITEGGEWTATMAREVQQYLNPHATPLGAAVDGALTGFVAHYATGTWGPIEGGTRYNLDTYDDVLDRHGVER